MLSTTKSFYVEGGMLFIGNRIHPDTKAEINARLANGLAIGINYLFPPDRLGTPSTRKNDNRLENNSTIGERIKKEVVEDLARLAFRETADPEVLAHHLRDSHADTIHDISAAEA